MFSKTEELKEDQKNAIKVAITAMFPGEKDPRVFEAVYKYMQNQKSNWSATTPDEYSKVVKKYYESALLAFNNKSNMCIYLIGGVSCVSALAVLYWYKFYANKKIRSRIQT